MVEALVVLKSVEEPVVANSVVAVALAATRLVVEASVE